MPLLGWFCYWAARGWVSSRLVRLVLALLVVAMPALGPENTANITNTIWGFGAVLPWALIGLSERPSGLLVRGGVAFLAATSTVLAVLFLPLALAVGLVRRTRGAWLVIAAFIVGLALQGEVVLQTSNPPVVIHPSLPLLAKATGLRTFAVFLLGVKGVVNSDIVAATATAFVAFVLLALLRGTDRRCGTIALILAGYAAVTYAVTQWERGVLFTGWRYSVMPVMFLASAVAILAAPGRGKRPTVWRSWCALVFAVWMLVLVCIGFSATSIRSASPTWKASSAHTSNRLCVRAPPEERVAVPTTPSFYGYSFSVTIRCGDLRWSRR